MDTVDGLCTYQSAAKLLGCNYWQVVKAVKKHNITKTKLAGSNSVLIRLSDLAQLRKPTK